MAARRTPLHERHLRNGGRIVDFAGWELPQQYTSVKDEHRAVRQAAGVFDVSHMGRFAVEGRGAAEFLDSLVTNDLAKLGSGRSQYNLLCNQAGGILDDLVVFHDLDERWHVVVNASNREKDLAWLCNHAPAGLTVRDRSDELALLAVQGPDAERMLPAAKAVLGGIPYFGTAPGQVAGVPALISRTGYTGEDGFELFLPAERVGGVWDALLEAGVQPCGLAARDVCRLEAGLRLYGNDMDEQTNPYEAGLGWTVKLAKGDFVGRQALQRVKSDGPARNLIGIRSPDRTIPRHHAGVSAAGRRVGRVTSGGNPSESSSSTRSNSAGETWTAEPIAVSRQLSECLAPPTAAGRFLVRARSGQLFPAAIVRSPGQVQGDGHFSPRFRIAFDHPHYTTGRIGAFD